MQDLCNVGLPSQQGVLIAWIIVGCQVPFFIQKDLDSWAKHSKGRCGSPVTWQDETHES